jgi:pantoate--beta-alanine ligase
MKVVSTVARLRTERKALSHPIGLVPTMGSLHAGHLSLIERARAESGSVIVSIFVNPTQFGPNEDFARYPRDLARDLRLCEDAGVDLAFTPTEEEVYPAGSTTTVEVGELQDRWEGASRPGHFKGVATVVTKLFRMAQPDRVYFGEKDYQQLQIVRRLAADLLLDVEVVGCPTARDADGLALSSRNVYLDTEARSRALSLVRALQAAQERAARGESLTRVLQAAMVDVVSATPGVTLDYAAIVDPLTLEPVETVSGAARALIAAYVDGVHLIDNAAIEVGQ